MSSHPNSPISVGKILASLPQTVLVRGISRAMSGAGLSEEQEGRILAALQTAILDGNIQGRQDELARAIRTLEGLKSKEAREREAGVGEIVEALNGLAL